MYLCWWMLLVLGFGWAKPLGVPGWHDSATPEPQTPPTGRPPETSHPARPRGSESSAYKREALSGKAWKAWKSHSVVHLNNEFRDQSKAGRDSVICPAISQSQEECFDGWLSKWIADISFSMVFHVMCAAFHWSIKVLACPVSLECCSWAPVGQCMPHGSSSGVSRFSGVEDVQDY